MVTVPGLGHGVPVCGFHTRPIFVFCLVWLFELTFLSNKICQNCQVPVCKGDNPNIKYESFEPMCIRTLFSRPAHSNSLVMELLLICLYSKLADFFRNFTFDSHRDLKLSRTQENVKFKCFSRSMVSFQGLFKTNFVFKDFSRLPFIFKYFSSLCEPCYSTSIVMVISFALMHDREKDINPTLFQCLSHAKPVLTPR